MKLHLRAVRVAARSCFAALPAHVANALLNEHADTLGAGGALDVFWLAEGHAQGRSALLTWAGGSSAQNDTLELSHAMCDAIGLPDGAALTVTLRKQLPIVARIFVEPCSADDWEVMQLHAGLLEEQMLNQVRAVTDAMILPLWISPSSLVRLRVKSMHQLSQTAGGGAQTVAEGLLATNSEVVVAPHERNMSGVARLEDNAVMLRVLAREHWCAFMGKGGGKDEGVGLGGREWVLMPLGLPGVGKVGKHRDGDDSAGAQEGEEGLLGVEYLFRAVDSAGGVAGLCADSDQGEPGATGPGVGQRVKMAVAQVRWHLGVPRGHAVLSPALRRQLNAPVGTRVHATRLAVTDVVAAAKIVVSPIVFAATGNHGNAVSSPSAAGTPGDASLVAATAGRAPAAGAEEGREWDAGAREALREWVRGVAPVKKRRVCVSDGAVVQLPQLARQDSLRDAAHGRSGGWTSEANSETDRYVCVSFRQGNGAAYPLGPGGGITCFGLWLHAVDEAEVELGPAVQWEGWQEQVWCAPGLEDVTALDTVVDTLREQVRVRLIPARQRKVCLGAALAPPGNLLVFGSEGSGKSIVCRALAQHFSSRWARLAAETACSEKNGARSEGAGVDANSSRQDGRGDLEEYTGCYSEVLSCRDLAEAGGGAMIAAVQAAVERACKRAPSLLVLDDAHVCVPSPAAQSGPGEVGGGDVARVRAQGLLMGDLLRQTRCCNCPVVVVASAPSPSAINPSVLAPGLLDQQVELPLLDRRARTCILRTLLHTMPVPPASALDVSTLAPHLQGFTSHDLHILAVRAAAAAASRVVLSDASAIHAEREAYAAVDGGEDGARGRNVGGNELQVTECKGLQITEMDLREARDGYVPPALRGAQVKEDVSWESVGGMEAAKATLLELVLLPTKYPDIFQQAPLRVRSGALLFGYPGCGKTKLVAALASHTGLNFLSVKGPELLNKYIGQSEQGVRDVFARASAAQPCILFFDEFDAIAPQRGHDSTGVTDRVVNQFLTALDGVEGLKGVFVIAATSRPEMIDAALLRPGRLDAHILCGMPDAAERHAILTRLVEHVALAPDVDLHLVARRLESCSGADLQALVYNAQVLAVHDALALLEASQEPGEKAGEMESRAVVTHEHIERAMADLRPSLTMAERNRQASDV